MVRSSGALAVLGVVCLGACDARPLRYGGGTSPSVLDGGTPDGDGGGDGGTSDAADGGMIVPARRQVTVGDNFSCALRQDRTAACWGFNGDGQATPAPAKLIAISAGSRFACGLERDGTIVCWGANAQKQSTPPAGPGFTQISAGDTHACAIASNGSIACWGSPQFTNMGVTKGPFVQVASGTDFTCAIGRDTPWTCWGRFSTTIGFPAPP
ncbi:MAG TPA: hypothetical protein VMU34_12420, partial [Mycobacterium sp.]|nr:hypothetical protein [Mycobacterium sp.]